MYHSRSAVLAILTLCVALRGELAATQPLPTITVKAVYPGANAKVVADTVAAPIEQQVNGVENMRRMWSRCADDGTYTLTITFQRGTDLNLAQVLVQNRVSLALPVLPAEVKRLGLTVLKTPAGILAIIPLLSPDRSRNTLYLSNYATIHLKDELARVPGVGDVWLVGQRDYTLRIWLDPLKLAARKLTAADVLKAIKDNNILAEAEKADARGKKEQGVRLIVCFGGRLAAPDAVGGIVVKADRGGGLVRLKDVANIELGMRGEESYANLDSKPAVALVVYAAQKARPSKVSAALNERLTKLRARFPKGIDFGASCDFTPNLEAPDKPDTPAYLLADVTLPDSASPERVAKAVDHCASLLRQTRGVSHVLTLTGENPFEPAPNRGWLLASLAPTDKERGGKEQVMKDARRRLQEVRDGHVVLRDLALGACPLELLVSGPDSTQVKKMARKLAERLRKTTAVTDLRASAEERKKGIVVEVDGEKARKLGVTTGDINHVLQIYLGSFSVGDFKGPGRTWRLQIPGVLSDRVKDIRQLQVRNKEGKMVPLGTMVSLSVREAEPFVYRLDGRPAERITASPALGVSPAVARKVCDKAAEEVRKQLRLPADYRLSWLRPGD